MSSDRVLEKKRSRLDITVQFLHNAATVKETIEIIPIDIRKALWITLKAGFDQTELIKGWLERGSGQDYKLETEALSAKLSAVLIEHSAAMHYEVALSTGSSEEANYFSSPYLYTEYEIRIFRFFSRYPKVLEFFQTETKLFEYYQNKATGEPPRLLEIIQNYYNMRMEAITTKKKYAEMKRQIDTKAAANNKIKLEIIKESNAVMKKNADANAASLRGIMENEEKDTEAATEWKSTTAHLAIICFDAKYEIKRIIPSSIYLSSAKSAKLDPDTHNPLDQINTQLDPQARIYEKEVALESQQNIIREDSNRINVRLLDFDGSIFNLLYHSMVKEGGVSSPLKASNEMLFNQIVADVNENNYSEVIFANGSLRQSLTQDNEGRLACVDNRPELYPNTQSCFHVLSEITDLMQEKLKTIPCRMEKYLLADSFAEIVPGSAYDLAIQQTGDASLFTQQHPPAALDRSKYLILYGQMHKVASEYFEKKIVLDFYSGSLTEIKQLSGFFGGFPQYIPANLVLNIYHYLGLSPVLSYTATSNSDNLIDFDYLRNAKIAYHACVITIPNEEENGVMDESTELNLEDDTTYCTTACNVIDDYIDVIFQEKRDYCLTSNAAYDREEMKKREKRSSIVNLGWLQKNASTDSANMIDVEDKNTLRQ